MLCEIKLSCECFNTSVTIEGSYLSVWQPVRVQIGNLVAVLVALVAFSDFSPMCVLIFILKLDACTQGRHWLHFCVCSPMCVILCFCNLCGQTLRLLASVYHHVNLQCIGESGGSVIVLLAAVWLFSDMLPHLVLS